MSETESNGLVPYTGADAVSTREAIVGARAQLARQRAEITRAQEEQRAELERHRQDIERQRREMEAVFEQKRAELEAQMRPLQEQLAKMTEVMWSVDLYLGRDETLQLIRDGQPAPADTPITVRQKVLVMAEESLVMMGSGKTGMDADGVPEFISWLCSDDAHLNRILPEQKGVIVLIPTRVQAKSGNVFEDAARDAANSESYWLLRNGERLYLLTVDPALKLGDRILPNRTEFVEVFDQKLFGMKVGEPVRPGSDEWFKLEKIADASRRHYMRVMMVLKGIVDRTPVWHPLPEGGVDFLSVRDQDRGKIVLIQDGDQSLQLGEAGETFAQWQKRLNGLLRPGLRVIGDWRSQGFRELYERREGGWGGTHPRMHPPKTDDRPETGVPHLLEGRKDGGFVIRFERSEQVYKRNVPVPGRPGYHYVGEMPVAAKQRASCVVKATDDWVLPLDLITVTELEKYLNSREERSKHFLSMVPVIRAALDAKRAEAAEESDFRGLLGQLLVAEGADTEETPALVDELVQWWKVAHTWSKALNGNGQHEKRAADQIVAEYRSRRRAAATTSTDAVVAAGTALEGTIAVARDRQGRWHAYAPSPGAHEPGVFLDVTRIYADGTVGGTTPWQVLATRTAAALSVAWRAEAWEGWVHGQNKRHRLTEPDRQRLIATIRERAASKGHVVCVTETWNPHQPETRRFRAHIWKGDAPSDAAVFPARDAFDWHWNISNPTITALAWDVAHTTSSGPGLRAVSTGRSAESFARFSGGTPWWPDDATRYADVRPRLAWLDEEFYAEVVDYRDRCAAAAKEKDDTRREVEGIAYRYVPGIQATIRGRQIAAVRQRFEEDYGRDADDLWDAHLKSLTIKTPIHDRDLWAIIASAIQRGDEVVGRTIADLSEAAFAAGNRAPGEWHHPRAQRVDVGDYGDVIVEEPAEEAEGD